MPHIFLHAYNSARNIAQVKIRAEIRFSQDYFNTPKAKEKLKEIQKELENVLQLYFDDIDSHRWLHDHDFNTNKDSDD